MFGQEVPKLSHTSPSTSSQSSAFSLNAFRITPVVQSLTPNCVFLDSQNCETIATDELLNTFYSKKETQYPFRGLYMELHLGNPYPKVHY